jgi:phospholipid/cholesterol/gamma-HCH transport system substrate-binding protein
MKLKFNKFERVAGLFILGAIVGLIVSMITVAVKQGWFEPRSYYTTEFLEAEGIHAGTLVQVSGLHVGSVEDVELTSENHIIVHFYVLGKFTEKIRVGSEASLIRPFVIGERVLDVTPGTNKDKILADGSKIPSVSSTDLMSILSGRNIGQYLDTFSQMLGKVHEIAKTVFSHDKNNQISETILTMESLVKNLNMMSIEVVKLTKGLNRDEKLTNVVSNLMVTTTEINSLIPEFKENAPHLMKDMNTLVSNLTEITTQFRVLIPAMATIGPELPRVSKRAVEALDEAVVLMKALQKSFFVRSGAKEVREEEAARDKEEREKQRAPASPTE